VQYRSVFLRVVPYFDSPYGVVKIQTTAILQNLASYKRLIIQHPKLFFPNFNPIRRSRVAFGSFWALFVLYELQLDENRRV